MDFPLTLWKIHNILIKLQPIEEKYSMKLTSTEIKIELLKRGITSSDLARKWEIPKENLSRVINRTPGFVFPEIRKRLARFLKVPVSAIGREDTRNVRLSRAA